MNAASNPPDQGLPQQSTAAATGPIPGHPGPGTPQPGARTGQPVQRPPGNGRPARAGLADEDNRFGGGTANSREEDQPSPAAAGVASARGGNGRADGREPGAALLDGDELKRTVIRWKEIQAHFVDEPRTAVEQADTLVAGLIRQLAEMLARERTELEQRWAGGDEASTEELRQTLRHYRSLFERLLNT